MGTLLANTCWPARFAMKWLAFFGVALFVGTILGILNPKPKPPPVRLITLDFVGFDVEGNVVNAQDQDKIHLSPTSGYELSKPTGFEKTVIFTPDAIDRYEVKNEKVIWQSNVQHQQWLDNLERQLIARAPDRKQRWHDIFKIYRVSTGRTDKAKFDYPVIFEKRKTAVKTP